MTIYEAIADIMKKGYAIGKEKENAQQHYKYRGIDDVMNTFQPLLAEHGVFVVPEVMEQEREERQSTKGSNLIYSILKMRYTFYSADGTSVSAVVIGEGMDSGDKASNKAMAVAMKYAMFQVFCIPTEEMQDPDAETPEVKPKPEPEKKKAKKATEEKAATKAEKGVTEVVNLPSPSADGYWYCADCNAFVGRVKKNDGSWLSPKEVVEMSVKRFGKCLCPDCMKKAQDLKNAAAT